MTEIPEIFRVDGISEFLPEQVAREDLRTILKAATAAPSAANAQPWEFIVLETEEGKKNVLHTLLDPQMCPLTGAKLSSGSWLMSAPLVLVMALDTMRAQAKAGPVGSGVFGLIDTGAAMQNLLISARSLGIGGTIIREFDPQGLRGPLELPVHVKPLLICLLGYSRQEPLERPCLAVSDIVHFERWNGAPEGL